MSKQAMQMALDALNLIFASTPPYKENGECTLTDKASKLCSETIEALEAELAKPEQEPVAWIGNADFVKGQFVEGRVRRVWWECNTGVGQPLYTEPPKREWVGLTQSEIEEIYMRNTKEGGVCNGLSIALEVQHMLKEKNAPSN